MTRQTAEPLLEYRTETVDGVAHEIVNTMRGFLILDPPYQRGTVWTDDQRAALVSSWIRGLPIQHVALNDRSRWERDIPPAERIYTERHLAIIDGKQRIETAILWFTGKFCAPASWFDPEWIESTVDVGDGPYVTFDGLTPAARRFTKHSWKLGRMEVFLKSVQEEAELYLLINGGGTPQTAADMANAAEVAGR